MHRKGPLHRRTFGRALALGGAAAIALATLTPSSRHVAPHALCMICGETGGVDAVLNVLLFIPFGAGLALAGVRPWRAAVGMFACAAVIELLQISVIAGRDASIGDVIMNSLGGGLGLGIGLSMDRWVRPAPATAARLALGWIGVWLTAQEVASIALVPAPTRQAYFGQLRRDLGGHPPYPGILISATLNGRAIPNTVFADSRTARDALASDDGATIDVRVVPRGLPEWRAAIVRVADAGGNEILSVSQDGIDLVFSERTNGGALRLRPAAFRLRGVFPGGTVGGASVKSDTIQIAARYNRRDMVLTATTDGTQRELRTQQTAGGGWRLVSPIQTYADGSRRDAALNALWLLALAFPGGYWFAGAVLHGQRRAGAAAALLLAACLAAGLCGCSLLIGERAATVSQWLGAASGIVGGAALSRAALIFRSDTRHPFASTSAERPTRPSRPTSDSIS